MKSAIFKEKCCLPSPIKIVITLFSLIMNDKLIFFVLKPSHSSLKFFANTITVV